MDDQTTILKRLNAGNNNNNLTWCLTDVKALMRIHYRRCKHAWKYNHNNISHIKDEIEETKCIHRK